MHQLTMAVNTTARLNYGNLLAEDLLRISL